jgi:hypothetical protein
MSELGVLKLVEEVHQGYNKKKCEGQKFWTWDVNFGLFKES